MADSTPGPVSIGLDDLTPFDGSLTTARAAVMIESAIAQASHPNVAPCILSDTFAYPAQAKAILLAAILRWMDAGSGALATIQRGPNIDGVDTSNVPRGLFWPSEIVRLQQLCQSSAAAGPVPQFTFDPPPNPDPFRPPWSPADAGWPWPAR